MQRGESGQCYGELLWGIEGYKRDEMEVRPCYYRIAVGDDKERKVGNISDRSSEDIKPGRKLWANVTVS